ncbi:MAG: T9SS type A sorting domain-containing protein [Bacteroidetes bacterium]|nr:T9SS type A sorting domain-containing protein [Bacteroidota bacterium]MBL6963693.1 T9SS type A sorting domain-containing protein [Bacteroidota bacterium]
MKKIIYLFAFTLLSLTAIAQTPQKVIIEHFTNSWCSVCANKNPAFYNLLDMHPDVIHIAYHPSRPYSGCIFSKHNKSENDARTNFYNIFGSTPRAVVNGEVIPIQSPTLKSTQLEAQLNQTTAFRIDVMQEKSGMDSILVKTVIHKIAASSLNDVVVHAQLVEKQVDYSAPNGENIHHDVFRKILTQMSISLTNTGDSVVINKKYAYHDDWMAEEMYVIVFIQDPITKNIWQAEQSNFLQNQSSSITDPYSDMKVIAYPNPVSGIMQLNAEMLKDYQKMEIIDLQGQIIISRDVQTSINVAELTEGLYILRFTGKMLQPLYTQLYKTSN